jgi:hypothetical protein
MSSRNVMPHGRRDATQICRLGKDRSNWSQLQKHHCTVTKVCASHRIERSSACGCSRLHCIRPGSNPVGGVTMMLIEKAPDGRRNKDTAYRRLPQIWILLPGPTQASSPLLGNPEKTAKKNNSAEIMASLSEWKKVTGAILPVKDDTCVNASR